MTKDMIAETVALKALLSDTADHQILAEVLGFVADRPPLGDASLACRAVDGAGCGPAMRCWNA